MKLRIKIGRRCLIALVFLVRSTTAYADTITKSFEIGTSATPSSNYRTFTLPCRTRMVASVTYSRAGAAGESNDVPLFVEVREPATTPDGEGAVVAVREGLVATRTFKTINLNGVTSDRSGCSIPWRVRVKHDSSGPAPVVVSGNITVSFNPPTSRIDIAGGPFSLLHGQSTTKNVGGSNGLGQGVVVIKGTWKHSILGATGPNAIKLHIELIDPSGRTVSFAEGYSSDEFRDLQKLKLTHRIADCLSGQWKLRVIGEVHDDVKEIDIIVNFTPDCP